ncbi:putative ankyrin repeat-containing protein-like isoform 2 [Capsicum annuum]|nr:putative ankyrin repeat-containing protein-like isoform 2 [Capsicum annuum]
MALNSWKVAGLSAKPTSWVFMICEAASADDAIKTGTLPNCSIINIGPSNEGHTEVVCVLLACIEDHNIITKEKLTSVTDASGDTALHKAVRSQHLDVVKLLVTEDSEFEFLPNHAQEMRLYLASESSFHGALINILISCKKPTYAAGPSNRMSLLAAVIQEHKGLQDIASAMLGWKISLVCLPADSENDWTTATHITTSEEVLKITPALLCYQNKKNETALHIAANEGHTEVIHVLLVRIEDHNTKEKLTRMIGASGDTALHKAVRSQHLDVVKILVKEDPEFEFPPNHAEETPLYLAAESGFHDALINILESCKKPIYATDCIRSLWHWNKPLCEELDLWGWNSLHYAVKLGLEDVVFDMLGWKKSLVYLPTGSENDWTTIIHITASEDDVNMINKLLDHCPNCWDMLNRNNQNALHVAVLNNQDKVVRFLLDSNKYDNLVDEPDSDGNSPLHLVVVSGNHVPELINHPRAKPMSFIKQNQTPLDTTLLCTVTTKKEKLVDDLCSIGRFGKRDFKVKRKYEYMHNPNNEMGTRVKMQLREVDHDKAKKADQTEVESIMKATQIHIVVATLIMTVTFAAGITLPEGFERDSDSPNQGMEILIRKITFCVFVVSDAIAFTF